jgi:hypothetical protein
MVRFSILALLTQRFGPQVVGLVPTLLRGQGRTILLLGAAAVGVALVRKYGTRWREIAAGKLAVSTQPNRKVPKLA